MDVDHFGKVFDKQPFEEQPFDEKHVNQQHLDVREYVEEMKFEQAEISIP